SFNLSHTSATITLSLHDALPIFNAIHVAEALAHQLVRLTIPLPSASQALPGWASVSLTLQLLGVVRNVSHTPSGRALHIRFLKRDRKSTRLNSSHRTISYAVFCL